MPRPWASRLAPFALLIITLSAAGCASGQSSSSAAGSVGAGATPVATEGGESASLPADSGTIVGGGVGTSGSPAASDSGGASASTGPAQAQSPAGSAGPAPSGAAAALQAQFVAVVQQISPSVVVIETAEGLGSGVVFDGKGDIVTNAHVAGSATSFKVTTANGTTLQGSLVGLFTQDDVAVIRVKGATPAPAKFGDSSALKLGDIVLAIGNPLGLQSSVTEGIVSATGRVVSEPSGVSIPDMIQTSAAINPGNSGGALVDLAGEVIGIPTLAASDPQMGGSAPGIGFAVSSNMAVDIARQLVANGKVTNSHRAYLGVQLADNSSANGALVSGVVSGGPAAKAGIREGDRITSVAGKPITSVAELSDAIAALQPGQGLDLGIATSSGTKNVHVTLGQFPGDG